MGTYGLDEIIHRWGQGTLTVEQVIGQILLLLQSLEERLRDIEQRSSTFRRGHPKKT